MLKRLYLSWLMCWTLLSFSVLAHAGQKFVLDEQHTYVLWHINHLGFSPQVGKWYAKGFIVMDKNDPSQDKVEATIDVATLITGLPALDTHLKSKVFLDVERYPTATFISNKVEVISKTSMKVYGILTLHGVSKPVVLSVTLNKEGKNPFSNKMSAGFTGTTTIKRSDFGINTMLPDLGDEVTLDIGAEAYQATP